MADRYDTPGGWTVEVVQLPTGDRLLIRHHGFYVAESLTSMTSPAGYRPPNSRSSSASPTR